MPKVINYDNIYGGIITSRFSFSTLPLSTKLTEDIPFSGFYIDGIILEEVKKYEVLYYIFNLGWKKARADNKDTGPARGISLNSGLKDSSIQILLFGSIYNKLWNLNTSYEPTVYTDVFTAGQISQQSSERITEYRQPIGLIQSQHQVFFHFYGLWMYNHAEGF